MLNTTYAVRPGFFHIMIAFCIIGILLLTYNDYKDCDIVHREKMSLQNKIKLFLKCSPINIIGMFVITLVFGFAVMLVGTIVEDHGATRQQIDTYEVSSKVELVTYDGTSYLEKDNENGCFIYSYINHADGHINTKTVDFKDAIIIPVEGASEGYFYTLTNENHYQLTTPGHLMFFPGTEVVKGSTKSTSVFVIPYDSVKDYQAPEPRWV